MLLSCRDHCFLEKKFIHLFEAKHMSTFRSTDSFPQSLVFCVEGVSVQLRKNNVKIILCFFLACFFYISCLFLEDDTYQLHTQTGLLVLCVLCSLAMDLGKETKQNMHPLILDGKG